MPLPLLTLLNINNNLAHTLTYWPGLLTGVVILTSSSPLLNSQFPKVIKTTTESSLENTTQRMKLYVNYIHSTYVPNTVSFTPPHLSPLIMNITILSQVNRFSKALFFDSLKSTLILNLWRQTVLLQLSQCWLGLVTGVYQEMTVFHYKNVMW